MKNLGKISVLILMVLFTFNDIQGQVMKPELVSLDTMETVPLRDLGQTSFAAGEKLKYRLHYGFVDAGEAIITIDETSRLANGREMFHIVGKGRTVGAFNLFYKVRDRYETYIDKKGIFPWYFVRRINEGGYKKSQDYEFHQDKLSVYNGAGKTFKTPAGVQDMLSAFYYARTLDFSKVKKGDVISVETFMDDELFTLNVKYLGKETKKLRAGKFKCLKFVPVVQEGRIFKSSDDMTVWITDDENHIPILIKAKILVGSIKMEMVEYEGLANPIAKVD